MKKLLQEIGWFIYGKPMSDAEKEIKILENEKLKMFGGHLEGNYDSNLDAILKEGLKSGVKKIIYSEDEYINKSDEEPHDIDVLFNNCVLANIWNANKWYGWCSQGKLSINKIDLYEWRSRIPSIETLHELYLQTRPFVKKFKEEKINIENILKTIEENKGTCN